MALLEMSLAGTAIISCVFLIRCLALYRLPKRAFTALWGVAVLRLLVPFRIHSALSLYSLGFLLNMPAYMATGNTPYAFSTALQNPLPAGASAGLPSTELPSGWSSTRFIVLIWALVAMALFLLFIFANQKWRKVYRLSIPLPALNDAAASISHKPIRICSSNAIHSPLTYGVFRPVILFPAAFDFTNKTHLHYALLHECTHIKSCDALKKWVLILALCMHWFNPFVWLLFFLANRDIELSCDEQVLATLGEKEKCTYAGALVSLEEKRASTPPVYNYFSKSLINERIRALMKYKKATMLSIGLSFFLICGVAIALATSAAPQQNPAAPRPASVFEANAPELYPTTLHITGSGQEYPVILGGVTEDGTLEAPQSATEIAWYAFSALPGAEGNAIFYGNLLWQGRPGAGTALAQCKAGETLSLAFNDGTFAAFTVASVDTSPFDALPEDALNLKGESRLTLITCAGDYDHALGTSKSRIIVTCVPGDAP